MCLYFFIVWETEKTVLNNTGINIPEPNDFRFLLTFIARAVSDAYNENLLTKFPALVVMRNQVSPIRTSGNSRWLKELLMGTLFRAWLQFLYIAL